MRIFLDTSVFVAACASESGGSRYIFAIAQKDPSYQLITNSYAIVEAKRNVLHKLLLSYHFLQNLITSRTLVSMQDPPQALIRLAAGTIHEKDAPILAGAIFGHADILCTLDKKDFHTLTVKTFCSAFGITIQYPGDVVKQWRDKQREG